MQEPLDQIFRDHLSANDYEKLRELLKGSFGEHTNYNKRYRDLFVTGQSKYFALEEVAVIEDFFNCTAADLVDPSFDFRKAADQAQKNRSASQYRMAERAA